MSRIEKEAYSGGNANSPTVCISPGVCLFFYGANAPHLIDENSHNPKPVQPVALFSSIRWPAEFRPPYIFFYSPYTRKFSAYPNKITPQSSVRT